MILDIGENAGKIQKLLQDKGGFLNFQDIKRELKAPDCLILMSLGWLTHKGHVRVAQDTCACNRTHNDFCEHLRTTLIFAQDRGQDLKGMLKAEVVDTTRLFRRAIGRVLNTLNDSDGLVTLKEIERDFDAPAEIILMAVGYLAKEGHVKVDAGEEEVFIFRLPQPAWAQNLELLAHYLKEE